MIACLFIMCTDIVCLSDEEEVPQYQNPQYNAVVPKYFKVIGFDIAHQEFDHWVDSRESSLLRRLERGREIGR